MNNLRLFIGIALDEAVSDKLAGLMERMKEQLPFRSWTHPDDLHITLHFLGETPADRLDAIRAAAAGAAAASPRLPLALTRPGTFGPPGAPRILWCGVAEPAAPGALAALQADMAPRLAATGFVPEERPFRPHVTMARKAASRCEAAALDDAWRQAMLAAGTASAQLQWTAEYITLFRSHLGRSPSYERLDVFPLGRD